MKNKQKLVVLLALLLTLALLTFTGCVTKRTTYDLSKMDILTISDATEEVLSSCVVVDVEFRGVVGVSRYSCIGLAIEKDKIIIPTQAMPLGVGTTEYQGRIYGTNQLIPFYKLNKNYEDEELGFRVLYLTQKGVELKPIKFGDSDKLQIGEMLFGVQYDAPITTSLQSETAADYMLMTLAQVSSKKMAVGSHEFSGLTEQMIESSFTTYGYFQQSNSVFYDFYKLKGYSLEKNIKITNCWLFNSQGEFVGANYSGFVDESENNRYAIAGIGYAYKGNAIKKSWTAMQRGVL